MRRKWIKFAGVALALLALLVAVAPMLASGVVRSRVERELASRLDATVSVESVSLGWFSPQRVHGVRVESADAEGSRAEESLSASLEVREGLLALLTGDEVHAVISGDVATSIGADGSLGFARLLRRDGATGESRAQDASASDASAGAAAGLLGGRRVVVEFDTLGAAVAMPEGRRIEVVDLDGGATVSESADGALSIELEAKASTRMQSAADGSAAAREGSFAGTASCELPRRANGSFDLSAASASVSLDADRMPLPSAAGEVLLEKLVLSAELSAGGAVRATAKGGARVAGAEPASVDASLRIASLFDGAGAVSIEPDEIEVQADVRALPLAAFEVFAPSFGGTRVELAEDIGPRADLSVRKGDRGTASIDFESKRLRLRFEGRVSEDGRSIEGGSLEASAALRPQLVRALTGVDAVESLAFTLVGRDIAWKGEAQGARAVGAGRAAGSSAGSEMPALRALAGSFECVLARPATLRGAVRVGGGAPLDLALAECKASVAKAFGAVETRVALEASGSIGGEAGFGASLAVEVDPASMSMRNGTVDANLVLAKPLVDSLVAGFGDALPVGALVVRGSAPTLRVRASELVFAPAANTQGAPGVGAWPAIAERLALRARVELSGAIECGLGAAPLALSGLAADLSIAAPGSSVLVDAGAKVDGASLRVTQQMPRLPVAFDGPTSLEASGMIEVRAVDPALAIRLAPDARAAIEALGPGPISASLRNQLDGAATGAGPRSMRMEVAVDASAVDAQATLRLSSDAMAFTEIKVDGSLRPEVLALIPKDAGVDIEPGASVALRADSFTIARAPAATVAPAGAATVDRPWRPAGDIAARITVPRLRVRRAPGVSEPLPDLGISLSAGYSFANERATLSGEVAIGSEAADGRLALDLAWRKPVEAKLFAGVEGSVALTGFDPRKLDAALGADGLVAGVAPSAILGGVGAVRIALDEKTEPRANVAVDFPQTRAALALAVREVGGTRRASIDGTMSATIAPDSFARLAGLADDPTRRVRTAVEARVGRLRLDAPLEVPAEGPMRPRIADAALEVDASLSDILLELTSEATRNDASQGAPRAGRAQGGAAPKQVASGPLRVELRSERLAESVRIRVQSNGDTRADGAAPTSTASPNDKLGRLEVDLLVRGLLASGDAPAAASTAAPAGGDASPIELDGSVRATRYPAATLDALAATGGALQRYLGDTIDAEVVATRFALASLSTPPGASTESPSNAGNGATRAPGRGAAQPPRRGQGAGRGAGGTAQSGAPGRNAGGANAATGDQRREAEAREAEARGVEPPAVDPRGDDIRGGAAQDGADASAAAGHLSVRIASDFAELTAPRVECEAGLLRIRKANPMTASLTMSPAVRDELLRTINTVFSDVETRERARFTVQSLAYPLDGDLRRMNANFRLEVGEVKLTNASWLAKALTIAQAESTGGFDARIEPLEGRIARGRLTYRDFALRIGKTRQGAWKHSVVFDGDVDLGAKPMYVHALTTALPLAEFGNWSSRVKSTFDKLAAISPELVKSLKVGVKLHGPLADASGAPIALEQDVALPEIDDILKQDPSLLLRLGPALIGELRKAFD